MAPHIGHERVRGLVAPRGIFSSAFITIQSRSPWSVLRSFAGSHRRRCETLVRISAVIDCTTVEGLSGSRSRIMRRISLSRTRVGSPASNGVRPASNS